jgi:hypothetical protein
MFLLRKWRNCLLSKDLRYGRLYQYKNIYFIHKEIYEITDPLIGCYLYRIDCLWSSELTSFLVPNNARFKLSSIHEKSTLL